jgi:hypothetical protein
MQSGGLHQAHQKNLPYSLLIEVKEASKSAWNQKRSSPRTDEYDSESNTAIHTITHTYTLKDFSNSRMRKDGVAALQKPSASKRLQRKLQNKEQGRWYGKIVHLRGICRGRRTGDVVVFPPVGVESQTTIGYDEVQHLHKRHLQKIQPGFKGLPHATNDFVSA